MAVSGFIRGISSIIPRHGLQEMLELIDKIES